MRMNNRELENILKSALVPERPKDYWDSFAGKVQREIQQREKGSPRTETSPWHKTGYNRTRQLRARLTPALGFGFAMVCLTLLLAFHFWPNDRTLLTSDQVSSAAKYFREIQALFPHQLETIAFDQTGAQLVLADRPDVPTSQPLFVKICGGSQCRSFVTFSGQEIHLDGKTFQILVDRQGAVMVVGEQWAWSSSMPDEKSGRYRIAARPLPTT